MSNSQQFWQRDAEIKAQARIDSMAGRLDFLFSQLRLAITEPTNVPMALRLLDRAIEVVNKETTDG